MLFLTIRIFSLFHNAFKRVLSFQNAGYEHFLRKFYGLANQSCITFKFTRDSKNFQPMAGPTG